MVRSVHYINFRTPWPFVKRGRKGWRKIGPVLEEKPTWPSRNREFPELNPKWYGFEKNPKQLHNYTHVKQTGYRDPTTDEFLMVKEMIPELVVPDISNFPLKPYVSYRADVEIEKRCANYAQLVKNKGSEELADLHTDRDHRWPPPAMTAKTLFDLHYADKIREDFKKKSQE